MPQITWSSFLSAVLMSSAIMMAMGLFRRHLIRFGKGLVAKGICLIAAIRLLCPFTLPSISLFPEGVLTPYGLNPIVTLWDTGWKGNVIHWLPVLVFALLGAWVLVAAVLLLRDLRKLFQFYRQAPRCTDKIDEKTNRIAARVAEMMNIRASIRIVRHSQVMYPAMIGFFQPTIFLPDCDWSERELMHIFAHELTHYRHGDAFLRVFFMLLQDVFWWNPLVYQLQKWVEEACEFHCDYSVTRTWEHKECVAYAYTITKAVEQSQHRSGMDRRLAVAFAQSGEHVTLERFRSFMTEQKKISWGIASASLFTTIGLCVLSWMMVPVESYAIADQRTGEAYMVDRHDGSFDLYINGELVDAVIGERSEIEQSMTVYD